MNPKDYDGKEPRLLIEEYFLGEVRAWGLFEDRFGNLRRQFVVDITGTMDGDELVLDERFLFDDGETDTRVWRIRKLDDHTYEGRADDVVGTASGISYGNALNWAYDLDLQVGDRTVRVRFDDWMFLQPDGVLLNRARMSKWGIAVGEVTLAFKRLDQSDAADLSSTVDAAVDAAWPLAANQ